VARTPTNGHPQLLKLRSINRGDPCLRDLDLALATVPSSDRSASPTLAAAGFSNGPSDRFRTLHLGRDVFVALLTHPWAP
jgi:hypothetical protein